MKNNLLIIGGVLLAIAVFALCSTAIIFGIYNRYTSYDALDSMLKLRNEIGALQHCVVIDDDLVDSIRIYYDENKMYRDRKVSSYMIHTNDMIIQGEYNSKGIISPLFRSDYKETELYRDIPIYILYDHFTPDEIIDENNPITASIYMVIILNNHIIAVSSGASVSDTEAFYNEFYNKQMQIITDTIDAYMARPIW